MNKGLIDYKALTSAAYEGLKQVRDASGQETDPALQAYNRLQPGDFPVLMQKYGTEGMLRYIQMMETKKAQKAQAQNG